MPHFTKDIWKIDLKTSAVTWLKLKFSLGQHEKPFNIKNNYYLCEHSKGKHFGVNGKYWNYELLTSDGENVE